MTDALGLSLGLTNLGAARTGSSPIRRRSVLTLFEHRAPEVGLPDENPALTESGQVIWGFAERVGDPIPLVAADGSSHRGDVLAAEALAAMARATDLRTAPARIAIAYPAYWGPAAVGALRGALRNRPELTAGDAPADLVSDAAAALAALQAGPGLPGNGVIALCDFGGNGTTIALADAGAGFAPVGEVVRFGDFSGELIDQAVLNHVLAAVADVDGADSGGTAAVGSLVRLRSECRAAKERLSAETATVIPVALPGTTTDVRLTRAELDGLIASPLAGFLDALADTLERNRIPVANLAAVATVGGGAAIPVITQQLSEQLRVPVVTVPEPGLAAAGGAAVLAERGPAPDAAATGLAPAADFPTGLATAAWAAGAGSAAATQSATDGASSATFRALAWSQDDVPAEEPVAYTGADYSSEPPDAAATGGAQARPPVQFERDDQYTDEPPLLPWYRRPPVLFGAAAAAALLAAGGLAVTLTSSTSGSEPVTETVTLPNGSVTTTVFDSPTSATFTYTDTNGRVTSSVMPPPSTTTTTNPTTTTTTSPTTTTTTSPTTTTTTTTTTATTTTTPTTTTTQPTTTTTQPPTTTTQQPTTSQAPTTQAPTTQAPTTPSPTAQAPTSQAPAPTTQAPATQAPATEAATTQPPVTKPPVTTAPAPTVVTPEQAAVAPEAVNSAPAITIPEITLPTLPEVVPAESN